MKLWNGAKQVKLWFKDFLKDTRELAGISYPTVWKRAEANPSRTDATTNDETPRESGASMEAKQLSAPIKRQLDILTDLLARKNADYGNSAFDAPPLAPGLDTTAAILVRMGDKISRLETLAKRRTARVKDESFDDTVRDLAGYCVLYLAASADQEERERSAAK